MRVYGITQFLFKANLIGVNNQHMAYGMKLSGI